MCIEAARVAKGQSSENKSCIAGNRSWLLIVFPRPKIIVIKYYILYSPVKCEISSCAPGWPDDPLCDCCIDRPFQYHVTGVK
jgi:hypothetical protein